MIPKLHSIFPALALVVGLSGFCFGKEPVVPGLAREHPPEFAGRVLLSELNCTACHASTSPLAEIPVKGAPDLSRVSSRIHRDYLEEFIADPHATKPGTTMPDVFGDLPAGERKKVAEAIIDFLNARDPDSFTIDSVDPEAADRGSDTFHKVGCAACHDAKGIELKGSVPLHRLEDKYSLTSLTTFLEDPLAVRPGGRMPNLNLSHWEATDIANYLLRDQQLKPAPPREEKRIDEGRSFFEKYRCAQCHSPSEAGDSLGRGISFVDRSRSCKAVDFGLSDSQQAQIEAALPTLNSKPDPESEIRLTLTRLNCIACHTRGDFGGPAPERDGVFTTTNLNLGEQARIPPTLTGIGAKLNPKALRKVLVLGDPVRPYMNTRMPRFGTANVEPLLELFLAHDSLPDAEFTRVKDEKAAREAGHQLAGDKNLSCVACHTFNGESATTLAGMEMTIMAERLRENWFHLYLRNPQQFHPTTIMPGFWPGGKSVRPEILEGDTGKQIDAIWQYLSRGREARQPSGIRREPIEYGPTGDEAVMLRRQYNGIGKRGIGVGYPAGINLSFDAGQLRLGSIWKGDFAEMSGVWRGQGSGNVGERSREIVRFPVGPAFARLDSPEAPWPIVEKGEKVPGFQFKGYTLDKKRRPTFRYVVGDLTITDAFRDQEKSQDQGPVLIRTLSFDSPPPAGLYFRAAADKDLKTIDGNLVYELPRGLSLLLGHSGELREIGEEKELLISLEGKEYIVINYVFRSP